MSATGFCRVSGCLPRSDGAVSVGLLILLLTGAPAGAQTAPSSLGLEKSGVLDLGADGVATPGDLIDYTFTVRNEGDVTQTSGPGIFDIAVTDPLVPTITCPGGNPIPVLDFGSEVVCTGSYAITQDDIDAFFVDNTATATGLVDREVQVTAMASASVQMPQVPAIELTKTGALDVGTDGVANPGDPISYSLEVTNSGNVTLTSAELVDPVLGSIDCPDGNPVPVLAPGAMVTCTGGYAIVQGDIDAGFKFNSAEVSAMPPRVLVANGPPPVTAQADLTVPIPRAPSVTLGKSGLLEVGSDSVANPGDMITYSLVISNTGNLPLTEVTLTDTVLASFSCPSGHPIAKLDPGAAETCSGTYAITQGDIDQGFKENTAEVTAQEPPIENGAGSATRAVTGQAMVRVNIAQQPGIQIIKTGIANLGADGFADAGDLIDYTLLVSNTGNVTLTGVAVTDPLLPAVTCPSGNPIPTLVPAGSETCGGSYALTAADTAAGSVANTAAATGVDPRSQPVTADSTTAVALPPRPMPTLGQWGLLVLALVLGAAGALALSRRAAAP